MSEIENLEAVLQNFIMEIKKVKESFPSLFAVENVNDLQIEERKFWEEYKCLFKEVEMELYKSDMPAENVLDGLKNMINDNAKHVQKAVAGIKNTNRKEFLGWIGNRLGVLLINVDRLLTKDKNDDDGALQKSKDALSREKKQLLF